MDQILLLARPRLCSLSWDYGGERVRLLIYWAKHGFISETAGCVERSADSLCVCPHAAYRVPHGRRFGHQAPCKLGV